MKIRFILKILLFFIFLNFANAGLTFSPEVLTPNQKMTIKYTNDGTFHNSDKIYAMIYCFNDQEAYPKAEQIALEKTSEKDYHATFIIPDKCVFGLIKVGFTGKYDANYKEFWDFQIQNSLGTMAKGSYLKKAISFMGNLTPNCNRNIDLNKALDCMEKEIKFHPDNLVAKIGFASLKHDLHKITTEVFTAEIRGYYEAMTVINDENVLIALSRALKAINEKEKAEVLETDYISRYSFSKIAEDRDLNNLQKANSFEEFKNSSMNFLTKYPKSGAKEKVWLALLKAYNADRKIDEFKEFIKTYQNVPSAVYSEIAAQIIKIRPSNSIKIDGEVTFYTNKAIEVLKFDQGNPKPDYLTESEWEEQKGIKLASIYIFLADGLTDDQRYNDAIDNLLKAKALLGGEAEFDIYDSIIDNYLKLNDKESAFIISKEAIVNSASSTYSDSVFKEFYFRFTTSAKGYEPFLDSLTEVAKMKRLFDLNDEVLFVPVELGEVLTSDGIKVDSDIFNGKIVILNLFSTWCEPCKDAFPAVERLDEMYNDNPKVDVFSIDVWEKGPKRKKEVRKFVAENEIEMPVYVDSKNTFPISLGLTGLPARVYIDSKGNIRFKEYGFDGEEKLIRDAEDKIQYLLEEQGDK